MSARSTKRKISRLFYWRFRRRLFWPSQEEQEWLDMAPIGLEFGSADYLAHESHGYPASLERSLDVTELKGRFGKPSRTVPVEQMNPLYRSSAGEEAGSTPTGISQK